jgi:hypothetical protein
MKARKTAAGLLLISLLTLTGWMFVKTIWIPLYGSRETSRFVQGQEEPILQVDVVRDDGKQTQAWSIADQQAIAKLRAGLQRAEYTRSEPPRTDERYRLRVRRADSRVDEYEVLVDSASPERDMLYVVRRNGRDSIYGSAFNTPELRSALQQVLKAPPAVPPR